MAKAEEGSLNITRALTNLLFTLGFHGSNSDSGLESDSSLKSNPNPNPDSFSNSTSDPDPSSGLTNLLSVILIFLLVIYSLLVLIINLRLFNLEPLYIYSFSVIFGVLATYIFIKGRGLGKVGETIFDLDEKPKINIPFEYLVILILFLALIFRVIPYSNSSIPLGYDPGIYKYEIERYWQGLPEIIPPDLESWDRGWSPPGLFILTNILHLYGFNQFDHYNALYIFFDIIIALGIYVVGKRFYSKEVGLIAAFFFSVSRVQFGVFYLFFFKNVLAIFLTLITLYLFKTKKYIPLVIVGAVVGAVHRPTFLILGLVYVFSLIPAKFESSNKDLFVKIIAGGLILVIALGFFMPVHQKALSPLNRVVESTQARFLSVLGMDDSLEGDSTKSQPQSQTTVSSTRSVMGTGTFVTPFEYSFIAIFYVPLAFMGFLISAYRRNFNPFFIWAVITSIIVFLQLFFSNRFIIHLDIAVLLLAGAGLFYLLNYNKMLGILFLIFLGLSAAYAVYNDSATALSGIDPEEFAYINSLKTIKEDAYVMSYITAYPTWLVGYSGKETIAPGLFNHNKWSVDQWEEFWLTSNYTVTSELMKVYDKPVYIYIGKIIRYNESKFDGPCFTKFFERNRVHIYRFNCYGKNG